MAVEIPYDSAGFEALLCAAFAEHGLAVVTGVFGADECDQLVGEIVDAFERLSPGLDHAEPRTWTRDRCPPQTRVGLYQCVVANLAPVWRVRADPRVARIFAALYSGLRGEPVTDFVASGDGVNLKPNRVGPYGAAKDWAHTDQTRGDPLRCAQGQAVLTTTTASLRASPGSHRVFAEVLAASGGPAASGWRKFKDEELEAVRALVLGAGGQWQVPVVAPKGSFILWASSTVHSARYQLAPEPAAADDPWRGWRCVVYVCYRPRADFTRAELRKRAGAFEQNRTTNHLGTHLFPKNPTARYGPAPEGLRRADGRNYVDEPELVYELLGRPELAPGRERRLAGYDDPLEEAPAPAPEMVLTDQDVDDLCADVPAGLPAGALAGVPAELLGNDSAVATKMLQTDQYVDLDDLFA